MGRIRNRERGRKRERKRGIKGARQREGHGRGGKK
jgi:hypothetical protein